MDAYEYGRRKTTSWSKEAYILPGDNEMFTNYMYLPLGNYTLLLKLYFCNDIMEVREFNVSIKKEINVSSEVSVKENVGKDKIILQIQTDTPVEKLIVTPFIYPVGWIFESGEATPENKYYKVELPYRPTIWKEANITIVIVSSNGEFIATHTVEIKKRTERLRTLGLIILTLIFTMIILKLIFRMKRKIL